MATTSRSASVLAGRPVRFEVFDERTSDQFRFRSRFPGRDSLLDLRAQSSGQAQGHHGRLATLAGHLLAVGFSLANSGPEFASELARAPAQW